MSEQSKALARELVEKMLGAPLPPMKSALDLLQEVERPDLASPSGKQETGKISFSLPLQSGSQFESPSVAAHDAARGVDQSQLFNGTSEMSLEDFMRFSRHNEIGDARIREVIVIITVVTVVVKIVIIIVVVVVVVVAKFL